MEQIKEITNLFDNTLQVIKSPTKSRENFKSLYKSALCSNKPLSQEQRRKELLERQKKAREENLNKHRDFTEMAQSVNPFNTKNKKTQQRNNKYKNLIMESEWLQELPLDFKQNWYCKLCPKGQRQLVVASRGLTQAFRKDGRQTQVFRSCLPGGSQKSTQDRMHCTMLDCIWDYQTKTYYVLDVLAWRNQTFINCDTDFRFYWLNTEFRNMPELGQIGKYNYLVMKNVEPVNCDYISLSSHYCSNDKILDGVLFYHRETHYTSGLTPLVCWLLPWMIPELISVAPPRKSEPKPKDIRSARDYMRKWIAKRNKLKRKNEKKRDKSKNVFDASKVGIVEGIRQIALAAPIPEPDMELFDFLDPAASDAYNYELILH